MEDNNSVVFVQFKEINSVEIVQLGLKNVTPMQILALAHFLEYKGKSTLSVQEAQAMAEKERMEQEKPKIEVPKGLIRT